MPVCQPVSLKDTAEQQALAARQPELLVVVAYGLILPQAVLDIPQLGCINVHASLLPRWRGAAPIQRAILAGDRETGVCLMQMEAGLDTGPVLACSRTEIHDDDTGSRLHDRLAALGGALMAEHLDAIDRQQLVPQPQDDALATYAHKLDKAEARIDWQQPAVDIERQVRAFNAWPVAETRLDGKQLRIWEAHAVDTGTRAVPGEVTAAGRDGIQVACGAGVLAVTRLQLPGARPVSATDFINAHDIAGQQLGGE